MNNELDKALLELVMDSRKENQESDLVRIARVKQLLQSQTLEAEIEANEAWLSLDRMIDPREFTIEIGRLELENQKLNNQKKGIE